MKTPFIKKILNIMLIVALSIIIGINFVACNEGNSKKTEPGTEQGTKQGTEPDKEPEKTSEENEPDYGRSGYGRLTYNNINSKTVTLDFYSIMTNDIRNNPTFAQILMIGGAIKYKSAHPEENVEIRISAFHFDIYVAACINQQSPHYGLMRSLPNSEYDNDGFVRLSYLLISAAKIGIDVKILGQLDGYLPDASFSDFFNSYLNDNCTESLPDKKVKDYLTCIRTGWTSYDDRAASDMMHYKVCTVSHLIDKDGSTKRNAVFLSSQNIDTINNDGVNVNNALQTATVLFDHDIIYRCAKNYFDIMFKNSDQEDVYNFRDIVNNRNNAQYQLISQGRANEIDPEEQILYLGSDSDNIFELYLTPLGSAAGAFDVNLNPYAKYSALLLDSDDYILFGYLGAKYNPCSFTEIWTELINDAFVNVNNPNSKLFISLGWMDSEFAGVIQGENASFKKIGADTDFHSKDIFVSWEKDGVRYYSVVLSSTNMHEGAFAYQANAMFVIKGQLFFDLYTQYNSFGMFA